MNSPRGAVLILKIIAAAFGIFVLYSIFNIGLLVWMSLGEDGMFLGEDSIIRSEDSPNGRSTALFFEHVGGAFGDNHYLGIYVGGKIDGRGSGATYKRFRRDGNIVMRLRSEEWTRALTFAWKGDSSLSVDCPQCSTCDSDAGRGEVNGVSISYDFPNHALDIPSPSIWRSATTGRRFNFDGCQGRFLGSHGSPRPTTVFRQGNRLSIGWEDSVVKHVAALPVGGSAFGVEVLDARTRTVRIQKSFATLHHYAIAGDRMTLTGEGPVEVYTRQRP